jgi:NAD(P)-dependent dehydrogenase (short-subunit alcohol dehydrogenase family)
MKKLDKKFALVTGANSGIGQSIAVELARAGATVAVTDLSVAQSAETMARVKEFAPGSIFVEMDVSDEDSVRAAIARTVATFGRLDIAVNNAGISHPFAKVHELETKRWQKVIDVNLTGQFLSAKHEIAQFLAQGGGTIVNVASLAGLLAIEGEAGYVAAKHGAIGLTETIALEYGGQNIRANAVCPYYLKTNLTAHADEATLEAWRKNTPAGRLGELEEISSAVLFLASDDSSYMNGAALELDGGMHVA